VDGILKSWVVVPVDGAAFRQAARLMHGRSNDLLEDALIAASALILDLIVVTRDVADFAKLGFVRTINPFSPRP
jgi:toxin FitB